ncbi:MAG: hypothetical protein ACJ71M_00680 [Nitrososphaeraceae archaeon]|jgi:hypothetical protein
MGAVFRPKDLPAGWRKRARESIKDLSPDTKDSVLKIIDSWEGTKSEGKLKEILGHDKAESLMKKITRTTKSKSTLTYDRQNQVRDMFRDSLTFD